MSTINFKNKEKQVDNVLYLGHFSISQNEEDENSIDMEYTLSYKSGELNI
jgi:hypothetical protein